MTDRALLEAAAKAAGIEYDKAASFPPDGKTYSFFGLWLVIEGEPNERTRRRWNPLTDDGDALRLAVKLRLVNSLTFPDVPSVASEQWVMNGGEIDWYAATRRAIVRAAAEIGKAMK